MTEIEKYFNETECPSIQNLSDEEIFGMAFHVKSFIDFSDLKILSLGCGDCRVEEILFSKKQQKNLTCTDFSERNLNTASTRLTNAKFVKADLKNLSVHDFESYDLIYSISTMQYLSHTEIKNLHEKLLSVLRPHGKIFHFNIPDNRRKFLYRLNNVIIMENFKYFLSRFDFVDKFSRWCSRNDFYIKNYTTKFLTPSYCWERFDTLLEKI